ncbi:MAG: hypothetical protein V3R73_00095 [Sphingomonadales bacterium]
MSEKDRERKAFRSELRAREARAIGFSDYYQCAHLWRVIEDKAAAEVALTRAGERAVTPEHWALLADGWLVLGKPGKARPWIERQREILNNQPEGDRPAAQPLTTIAAWLADCGADDQARDVLMQAEEDAGNDYQWIECARAWIKLDDPGRASRCLERASETTDMATTERISGAEVAADMGDQTVARFWIKKAEPGIGNDTDWVKCADIWQQLGNRPERKRALQEAENLAVRERDYPVLFRTAGEAWWDFGDQAAARRCMLSAEATSEYVSDLLDCAASWIGHGKAQDARRCLAMAKESLEAADREGSTELAQPWADLARAFEELEDETQAIRAVNMAEGFANTIWHWRDCSVVWAKLENREAEVRCLREAEKVALGFEEWLTCAQHWGYTDRLEDAAKAVVRAESLAKSSNDWGQVGQTWMELGNRQAVVRAFDLAEDCASETPQLLDCAWHWSEYGDADAVERCLHKAQTAARISPDWYSCSSYWSWLLADGERTASCAAEAPNHPYEIAEAKG